MYIGLITNYTVFKSLLEADPRKMTEIAQEKAGAGEAKI